MSESIKQQTSDLDQLRQAAQEAREHQGSRETVRARPAEQGAKAAVREPSDAVSRNPSQRQRETASSGLGAGL